jgi:ATP-dependent helicase/nuclease subunit A
MPSPTSELKNKIVLRQFIRAGAGAGKTTRLVKTFYEFAKTFHQENNRWPKVVLTTFTKKATQEIKERLLTLALENNDSDFVSYLSKSSLVQISTIHLLLQTILYRFHDKINLINQITLIDDNEEISHLFKLVKKEFSNHGEFIDLLEHYRVKELTEHIQNCIRIKKEFPEIDFVSTLQLKDVTDKKVGRILKNASSILTEIVQYRTTLSPAWTLYADCIQTYYNFLLKDKVDEALNFTNQMPNKPSFLKAKPPFPVELNEAISQLFSDDLSLSFTDTESYRTLHLQMHDLFHQLFNRIYIQWEKFQLSTGQITIADLELLSYRIATQFPTEIVAFAKEIDFIMLDEYQDTSPLQVKILQIIIENTNVFIVGDPQQSIYLFRGARTEVFLSQEEKSRASGFEILSLQNNYRSHPELLDFFNLYFTQGGLQFVPMSPGRSVESQRAQPRVQFIDSSDQLKSTVVKVFELHQMGIAYEDIAILCKKNSILLELNSQLKSLQIPADLQTASGLENKREILDCMSFLKFISNPYDEENLLKLVRSPWFFISDEELYGLRNSTGAIKNLWISIKNSSTPSTAKLMKYLDVYFEFGFLIAFEQFLLNEGVLDFSLALDQSGRMESNVFKFYQILHQKSMDQNFDLNKFVDERSFLSNSVDSNGLSESLPARKRSAVNLLTIHGAKGLQYKHVIVIGMNDFLKVSTSMPLTVDESQSLYSLALVDPASNIRVHHDWAKSIRRSFNDREMDESYRLLYVAMTRAEESICLISEDKNKKNSKSWKYLFSWPSEHLFKGLPVDSIRHDADQLVKLVGEMSLHVKPKKVSEVKTPFESDKIGRRTSLSVSDLLNLGVTRLADLQGMKTSNKENGQSVYRITEQLIEAQSKALAGTRAHTLFESIKYNSFLTDPQLIDNLNANEKKAIKYLSVLNEIPFLQIIENGYVEFGFKLKLEEIIIQGQIDAWGCVGSTAYLIDYKTGDQKFAEKAFDQLSLYSDCLRKLEMIKPTDKIVLVAIFPFENKTIMKPMNLESI